MKIYTLLLGLGLLLLSGACKNETECCEAIPGNDDHFVFGLKNGEGRDLLSPETQGSYNTSQISISEFDYEKGQYVKVYRPDFDAPKGYIIDEYQNKHRMILYTYNNDKSGDAIQRKAIIHWNEADEDTIELNLVQQYKHIQRLTKIVYNDQTVWDEEDYPQVVSRYFEIIK